MSRKAASPPSLKPGPTDLQPSPRLDFEEGAESGKPAEASLSDIISVLEAQGWRLEKLADDILVFRRRAPKVESLQTTPPRSADAPKAPTEAPRAFVGAEGIPERDFVPVPPQEEALPDGPPPAPKAPQAATSATESLPEPPPAAESGDICTSAQRWPGTTGDSGCFWRAPNGCRLGFQDRPLRCAAAGKEAAAFSPDEIEVAETREVQWEAANAAPVPRTVFDGSIAALDAMPKDKLDAALACLDGGPRQAKAAPPAAPSLPPGIVVGEMDAQGNPIPEEPPDEVSRQVFDAVARGVDKEIMAMGNEVAEAPPTEGKHTHDGPVADGPAVPPVDWPTKRDNETDILVDNLEPELPDSPLREADISKDKNGADKFPPLEERVRRDGIFEALRQSEPPRATEARDVVLDFETPVETQRLRNGQGHVYVKRDDLFAVAGVRGGKARACWALATEQSILRGIPQHTMPVEGLITAGSRMSPQCNVAAHIARRLGVPCRLHIPWAKAPLEGELAEAEALGAEVVQHRYGRNSVIVARAREDFEKEEHGDWVLIPADLECKEAVEQTRRQARSLRQYGRICERIVVPVGSGMSLAGILWGLRDIGAQDTPLILGVCVGADPRRRLDTWAPRGWRQAVTLRDASGGRDAYQRPAAETRLGDLWLDPIYEAKCLPFLRPRDLLWVVGIRNTVAGHRS